jgi:hypothetical protein
VSQVALVRFVPNVSPGGIVIIDDYGVAPGCRTVVHDCRDRNGIDDAARSVVGTGACWIKTK